MKLLVSGFCALLLILSSQCVSAKIAGDAAFPGNTYANANDDGFVDLIIKGQFQPKKHKQKMGITPDQCAQQGGSLIQGSCIPNG